MSLILSIVMYFIPFNNKVYKFLALIITNVYLLLSNIKIGRKLECDAYKNGLKNGIIIIVIMYFLGSILGGFKLGIERIIYYLIILLSIVLGNIIGINKKNS